jgi:hypothetical protein
MAHELSLTKEEWDKAMGVEFGLEPGERGIPYSLQEAYQVASQLGDEYRASIFVALVEHCAKEFIKNTAGDPK